MRAVLFDFGGTLDCPRHWLDRFLTHYRAAGLNLSRAELDPAFDAATQTAYRAAERLRNYSLRELLRYLVGLQLTLFLDEQKAKLLGYPQYFDDPSRIEAMARQISDNFVKESEAGLADSRAILSDLIERFSIGVVSNFYGNLERVLIDAGFGSMVGAIADSGRLGIYKPEAGLFEAALAKIGVRARDAVMGGDSIEKDCAPAQRLGMRTVWLRHREAPCPGSSAGAADFTITALVELKDVLCRIG